MSTLHIEDDAGNYITHIDESERDQFRAALTLPLWESVGILGFRRSFGITRFPDHFLITVTDPRLEGYLVSEDVAEWLEILS